eukprot:COSAG02_NODE_13404_length_1398_cov_5.295612_3_plen_189_part_00
MRDLKVDNHWSVHDWQMANHYPEKRALTTKVGLTETLASDAVVRFQADADSETFFPLSFNLNSSESLQQFLVEVGVGAARGVLRAALDAKRPVNCAIWKAALAVTKRFALDLNIDDAPVDELTRTCSISDMEWQLIHLGEQPAQQDDTDSANSCQELRQIFYELDLKDAPRIPFPRILMPSVRALYTQ